MSTTKEVAERTVLNIFESDPSWTNADLINAVDRALQAERERATKIAEKHFCMAEPENPCECQKIIAATIRRAIREGKPQ